MFLLRPDFFGQARFAQHLEKEDLAMYPNKLSVAFLIVSSIAVGNPILTPTYARASDLSVVTWGGIYAESQRKAYGAPWEAKTGKTIDWVNYNGGLAEIRAQVAGDNVLWDVVDVFPGEARTGCSEGLFEILPADIFETESGESIEDDLITPRPNDCVAPNIIWSWIVFYSGQTYGGVEPRSIGDFFDLEQFPGKRGLATFPQATVEMALVADGVDPAEVYSVLDTEAGLDRAFAKLESLGDQVVFWSSGARPAEMVASDEVVMSTAYNGRISEKILFEDADFRIIWDGQVLEEEWFVVVKGSQRVDDAIDFLKIAFSTKAQAEQARWIPYGPMRRTALKVIAENEPWFNSGQEVLPHMPDRAEVMDRTVIADPDWWAKNSERVGARYMAWMERL
ncbi:MAG: extracellular solute-binding protein [Boseongicola sp.]